jgi:hypothetical protein
MKVNDEAAGVCVSGDLSGDAFMFHVVSAVEAGVDLEQYLGCRSVGITHDDVMYAWRQQWALGAYKNGRIGGISHAEIDDAHLVKMRLSDYLWARNLGASHAQVFEAFRIFRWVEARLVNGSGQGMTFYCLSRDAGATHKQVVRAVCRGVHIDDYIAHLEHGMNHRTAFRRSRLSRRSR